MSTNKNQKSAPTSPAPTGIPPAAEKVKSSRFEWERDQVSEPKSKPGSIQARVRRWLQLAQQYFSGSGWDGDDDPTPSAA